nr:glycoside hydrolase [Rhizobium sp. Q54]
MKILLITVSLSSTTGGGTAERTRWLARHLVLQGHTCAVATIEDGDIAQDLRSIGIEVYATRAVKLRFKVPMINFSRLSALVVGADVIHILGYWNLLSIATAGLAVHHRKPYVFCAAGEFVGLEAPRPVSLLFHSLLGKRMLRHASLFIAITELERTQIMTRFKVGSDQVVVVPNGVELPPENWGGSGRPLADPYILFVGRLTEVKGPDLLLEAYATVASDFPDVKLMLAGPDFGLKKALQEATSYHRLADRVVFPGHLDEAKRAMAYRHALFLVVPSRSEAMSLVAVEAGAAGSPVLLTDRCGFDDVEAVGGGMVVPVTVEGLADGLRAMLERRDLLPQHGQALKVYVERVFAWPGIVRKFVVCLDAAVQGYNGPRTAPSGKING